MDNLICPKCGNTYLMVNSIGDRLFCNKCTGTFELTEVNTWYKKTLLDNANIENDVVNIEGGKEENHS